MLPGQALLFVTTIDLQGHIPPPGNAQVCCAEASGVCVCMCVCVCVCVWPSAGTFL